MKVRNGFWQSGVPPGELGGSTPPTCPSSECPAQLDAAGTALPNQVGGSDDLVAGVVRRGVLWNASLDRVGSEMNDGCGNRRLIVAELPCLVVLSILRFFYSIAIDELSQLL